LTQPTASKTYPWCRDNFGTLYDVLENKLKRFKVYVRVARFFFTNSGKRLDVHIDGTEELGHYYWAINFPIFVEKTDHYQEWYSYDGKYRRHYNETYTDSILLEEPEKIELIDKLILTEPHFVKVGIPHSISNQSDSIRLILSIRFLTYNNNLIKILKHELGLRDFLNSVRKNQQV